MQLLSDGVARLETMRSRLEAGPTAVLEIGNVPAVVLSHTVSLCDRALCFANGYDPRQYDATVVKSQHTEYAMYNAWTEKNVNIDIPRATSAHLPTLRHTVCARPIYPLDPEVAFVLKAVFYESCAP